VSNHYQGSCLCGGIKLETTGFNAMAANCHCSMCRKFHGAAYGTLVAVEGLKWLSGQELLKDFIGDNGTVRTFCSECGSSLGFRVKDAPFVEIELAISIFDEAIPVEVNAHIYTHYKANWCVIDDQLAKFEEGR